MRTHCVRGNIIICTKKMNTHRQVCYVCHVPCFIQGMESPFHNYIVFPCMGEGDDLNLLCMFSTIHIRIHCQSQSTYTICGNSSIEWGMYDIAHHSPLTVIIIILSTILPEEGSAPHISDDSFRLSRRCISRVDNYYGETSLYYITPIPKAVNVPKDSLVPGMLNPLYTSTVMSSVVHS